MPLNVRVLGPESHMESAIKRPHDPEEELVLDRTQASPALPGPNTWGSSLPDRPATSQRNPNLSLECNENNTYPSLPSHTLSPHSYCVPGLGTGHGDETDTGAPSGAHSLVTNMDL